MNKKYLNHSVEDLIADEAFIQWVINPKDPHKEKWNAWIIEHPQMQDKCKEARRFLEGLSFRKIDTSTSSQKIWSTLQEEIGTNPSNAKTRIRQLIIKVAAAACISLVILSQFWNSSRITIGSDPGIVTTHELPDGSQTLINDASSITYDKSTFSEERKISLKGEAFFEVQKGERFVVTTPQGDVEVLGTSFNIFSHDDQFVVQCHTGSVRVSTESQEVVLSPGQIATKQNDGTLQMDQISKEKDVDWRSGIYKYQNVSLKLVATELERQFGIDIRMKGKLEELKYTGFFEDDNLDKALSSVFWPLKLKYVKKQNHVQIQQEE